MCEYVDFANLNRYIYSVNNLNTSVLDGGKSILVKLE
jgi:hypothetical protein